MHRVRRGGKAAARGFAAVAGNDARVLVLGSLPGQRSIDAAEYYAHPRNVFWDLVEDFFGIPRILPYAQRTAALVACRVALWDVLAWSHRRGSLDTSISVATSEVNDFAAFYRHHPGIRLVCCNGGKASALYRRLALPQLAGAPVPFTTLPSTSPAHAAMTYAGKRARWTVMRDAAAS